MLGFLGSARRRAVMYGHRKIVIVKEKKRKAMQAKAQVRQHGAKRQYIVNKSGDLSL